jgi:hypothetical protein
MKRRLFNILAAVSLLLALAVAGLWVRSYWAADYWNAVPLAGLRIHANSQPGSLTFAYETNGIMPDDDFWTTVYREGLPGYENAFAPYGMLGYFNFYRVNWGSSTIVNLTVPDWFYILLGLILPTCWVLQRWRRRRHYRDGLCPACGYDLRASKDECPECGAKIPATS